VATWGDVALGAAKGAYNELPFFAWEAMVLRRHTGENKTGGSRGRAGSRSTADEIYFSCKKASATKTARGGVIPACRMVFSLNLSLADEGGTAYI
jgi:hypothetical protein